MKLYACLLLVIFLTSSCGALRLSPLGCRGNGVFGNKIEEGRPDRELKFTETYYVWNVDYEVRLKEFLKKKNIDCSEIKKMHVTMKSVFFVERELTVYVLK